MQEKNFLTLQVIDRGVIGVQALFADLRCLAYE